MRVKNDGLESGRGEEIIKKERKNQLEEGGDDRLVPGLDPLHFLMKVVINLIIFFLAN